MVVNAGGTSSPDASGARNVTKEDCGKDGEIARRQRGIKPSFSRSPIAITVLESISQIDGQIVIKAFGTDRTCSRRTVETCCA
jgi:cobalt-zinc-cadmium resistance protein CzcA